MNRWTAIGVGVLCLAVAAFATLLAPSSRRTPGGTSSVSTSETARVDALFANWSRQDTPGCSVGVRRNGQPVLDRGYGLANLELGVAITPETVFHVASVSKQFTAMSILLLAEAGTLSLDDEVWRHLPEWRDRRTRVTIRHLLTHTSGMRDGFLLRELSSPTPGGAGLMEEIVTLLARQRELNFPPSNEFQYSNSGYVLLAAIVSRVSGRSLRDYAEANIFKPLKMSHTHVHDNPRTIVRNRASGYHQGDSGIEVAPHADLGHLVGTTGLHTTTGDLLAWMDNLFAPRVGKPAFVLQMQQPVTLANGERSAYGFGLETGEHRGFRTISHGGGDPGFAAYLLGYPDHRLGVAVLCNLDNIGLGIGDLARRVADVYLPAESDHSAASTPPTKAKEITLSEGELVRWAGLYHDASDDSYGRIFVRGGKLRAAHRPGESEGFELTPVSPTRFVLVGTPIEVEFVPGSPGQPPQARVVGAGPRPAVMTKVLTEFRPSPADLQELAGAYMNRELEVTYALTVRDGRLVVTIPGRADIVLEPLVRDKFYGNLLDVASFARDSQGRVTGFSIRTAGVRRLDFERTTSSGVTSLPPRTRDSGAASN